MKTKDLMTGRLASQRGRLREETQLSLWLIAEHTGTQSTLADYYILIIAIIIGKNPEVIF